jgi:NADH:ubiquinone oxidoreductase subunit F (NADH-binding)
MRGLERALSLGPASTVEEVVTSGLRGRGGAGFPTGIKSRTTAVAQAPQRYRCTRLRRPAASCLLTSHIFQSNW